MLLLLLASSAPVVDPAPVKLFGDWAVACDNSRLCEATALAPEGLDGDPVQILIRRGAGADAMPSVEITLIGDNPRGDSSIEIDEKAAAFGMLFHADSSLTLPAPERALERMVAGKRLTIRRMFTPGSKPEMLGEASLTGLSAALRYIDAAQGRAGTVTALVAKGAKPASAVPAPPPVPQVRAVRPTGVAATLDTTLPTDLKRQAGCDEAEGETATGEVTTAALGGGKTLVLLPCMSGAYNSVSTPFVVESGRATPAVFDHEAGGDAVAFDGLVNAHFDAATGVLETRAKGRGIGDCGNSARYAWDGAQFRLIEAREMPQCRISGHWLRTWTADVAR